jgi:hypothetical protein
MMSEERSSYTTSEAERLARMYCELGWSLVPFKRGTKVAAQKYKTAQTCRTSLAGVMQWVRDGHSLAVVLGPVSGDLVVRDFDTEPSFHSWAIAYPSLAALLPTSKTSRGYHVFAIVPGAKLRALGDGELRAGNNVVILPPSLHPSGIEYQWIREPSGSVPQLQLADTGFDKRWDNAIETHTRPCVGSTVSTVSTVSIADIPADRWHDIEDAIEATIPGGRGQRNGGFNAIFRFARKVIGILGGVPDESLADRLAVMWYQKAESVIATKDPGVTCADFARALAKVRVPDTGMGPIDLAASMVDEIPVPSFARLFAIHNENSPSVRLAKFFVAFNQVTGGNGFYVSYDKAGAAVGMDCGDAWRVVQRWIKKGVLEVVEPGVKGRAGNKATRWRLLQTD